MRCPTHPDRIAQNNCTVCGTWHCAACAPLHRFLEEPVCPDCAPGLARHLVGLHSPDHAGGERRSGRRPRMLMLSLGTVAFVLLALLGTEFILPALTPGPSAEQRQLRLVASFTEVGLALEAFRAQKGSYPQSLSALVPEHLEALPDDPFDSSGAPLRYRSQGTEQGSIVLYSVGPDGIDDGGVAQEPVHGRGDLLYPVW
ncbi:MAG: hypothetical protein VX498_14765 [Myxococcota bacterium]|nr:hypothetical protein [Myxococcota bacterium]